MVNGPFLLSIAVKVIKTSSFFFLRSHVSCSFSSFVFFLSCSHASDNGFGLRTKATVRLVKHSSAEAKVVEQIWKCHFRVFPAFLAWLLLMSGSSIPTTCNDFRITKPIRASKLKKWYKKRIQQTWPWQFLNYYRHSKIQEVSLVSVGRNVSFTCIILDKFILTCYQFSIISIASDNTSNWGSYDWFFVLFFL